MKISERLKILSRERARGAGLPLNMGSVTVEDLATVIDEYQSEVEQRLDQIMCCKNTVKKIDSRVSPYDLSRSR